MIVTVCLEYTNTDMRSDTNSENQKSWNAANQFRGPEQIVLLSML